MSARAKVMTGQPEVTQAARRDVNGVHATHCCRRHWCKYGANDCPVVLGDVAQDGPCDACEDELADWWPLILQVNRAYDLGRAAGQIEGQRHGHAEGRQEGFSAGRSMAAAEAAEKAQGRPAVGMPVGVPAEAATAATGVVADLIRAAREWAATPLSMSSRPSKDKLAAAVKACTWIVLPPKIERVTRRGRS